jgi:mono/diheme cytochrome c family protein
MRRLVRATSTFLCFFSCFLLACVAMAAEQGGDAVAGKQPAAEVNDAAVHQEGEATASTLKDPDKDRKPSLEWGNELYGHYCIPCHGIRGNGHGFNASHLLVKPANHTDSKFMSERSDQKLFDTINLGGVEVAKSTLMPPWGAALNNDNKIKSLIMKLRDLCQCQATKNW